MRLLFGKHIPASFSEAFNACREHFLLAAGLSCLINLLYLVPTIYMLQIYDRVVPTGGLMTLLFITIIVVLALTTLAILDAQRSRILVRASLRVEKYLARKIVGHMVNGDLSSGRASVAMREFDTIRQVIGGVPAAILLDAPWVPIFVIVAFIIHPAIAAIILFAGLLLIGIAYTNDLKTRDKAQSAHKLSSNAYAELERATVQAETIRSLGMRDAIVERHMRARDDANAELANMQLTGAGYSSSGKFLRLLMQSLALGLGAWLAVEKEISVGAVIAASVLLSRALQPIEQLISAWPHINRGRASMRSLNTLLADTEKAPRDYTQLPDPEGSIELENAVFQYGQAGPVLLKNVSLRIAPGEFVGLVGPSGAGKTTIARLIANAMSPTAGKIRLDGSSYLDWPPDQLARHIGYLPQDYVLLPGTINDNISRFARWCGADKDEADQKVLAAARLAGVHDIILKLPDGYDTVIDSNGGGLSAGQTQRIALARALYDDPRIVILDEPDAALDMDGEVALAATISALKSRGATLITISHRLKLLERADRLVVFKDGQIAMDGPRQEILSRLAGPRKASDSGHVVSIRGKQ